MMSVTNKKDGENFQMHGSKTQMFYIFHSAHKTSISVNFYSFQAS